MERCVATGAAISKVCAVPSRLLNGFNDIDYGAWQFKTYEEVDAAHPALFAAWFATPHLMRFPDGECLQNLLARSADAPRSMLQNHANETVVAVAHSSINRALLVQLLDQPLSSFWRVAQDPCCINEIDIFEGSVCVRRINETHHLGAVGVRAWQMNEHQENHLKRSQLAAAPEYKRND
jgi:probable phosphoglycerate mutase